MKSITIEFGIPTDGRNWFVVSEEINEEDLGCSILYPDNGALFEVMDCAENFVSLYPLNDAGNTMKEQGMMTERTFIVYDFEVRDSISPRRLIEDGETFAEYFVRRRVNARKLKVN